MKPEEWRQETVDSEDAPLVIGLRARFIATDPCNLDLAKLEEIKLSPEEREKMVDAVVKFLDSSECPEHVRLKEDFSASELTAEHIRYVCNAMDRLIYGGRLLRKARLGNAEIWFSYNLFSLDPTKEQPCAKTVFSSRTDTEEKELVKVVFQFNRNRFGDSARCRETNGIQVRHKLEALITTTLHELEHLFWRLACKKPQGHNEKFRDFNHAINGAHPNKFGYRDMETCPVHHHYEELRRRVKVQ